MKKIHLILKTHLDLGFTDYAENILKKYINDFIPTAISLSEELNADGTKRFVWTTGSFLIKESLQKMDDKTRQRLINAINNGGIVWHGLPFTTHTELLDEDTFSYGLNISKQLDKQFDKKTIAAKMTDVPGHTKAIIPLMADAGIKLLHIGVNEASAVPKIPQAFLWKFDGKEIIVIYEGSYGSFYKNPHIDDILYFYHSADNHGPCNKNDLLKVFQKLKRKYPDYVVEASTLDAYAESLYKVKDKLPIITSEIGDTWIHGVATDPYKTAAYKELIDFKRSLDKQSSEYQKLSDTLLKVAEHTWGPDVKIFFKDFENYLKDDFNNARRIDTKGNFAAIQKGWAEQRAYIDEAVNCLSDKNKKAVVDKISKLIPQKGFDIQSMKKSQINQKLSLGNFDFCFDSLGLKALNYKGNVIIENRSNLSSINYRSFNSSDYRFWKNHYTRNYFKTKFWSQADFLRPNLKKFDKKYPSGRFNYTLDSIYNDESQIVLCFSLLESVYKPLGAASAAQIRYSLTSPNGLEIEVIWLNKSASRLTEATYFNLPIIAKKQDLSFVKLAKVVDLFDVVEDGSKNLSCTERFEASINGDRLTFKNIHAPLTSVGQGKILEFDNEYGKLEEFGVSYVLHNNVWGTNFPLWYQDNAYFKFMLNMQDPINTDVKQKTQDL